MERLVRRPMTALPALLLALLVATVAPALAGPAAQSEEVAAAPTSAAQELMVMVRMPHAHFRPDVSYGEGYRAPSAHEARRRIAADIARTYNLQMTSDWPMPALGVECFVMRVRAGQSVSGLVSAIGQDPRAAWAQTVQPFHGMAYNDPLFPLQPTARQWQLAELHSAATGQSVRIAELDSAVDRNHQDPAGQVAIHEDFTDRPYRVEAHGTAVAGILVARANNGIGIVGIAPRARLLALRACWQEGTGNATDCNSFTLAKALQSAIDRRAQVVNLSISGPTDRLLRELIDSALARGIVVVAAADPGADLGGFPASHRGVVSVAMDTDGGAPAMTVALVAAPGHDVPATGAAGGWGFVTGSSFAAAEVSGLIALLLERNPDLRPEQIRLLLGGEQRGVRDAGAPAPKSIDACRALSAVAGGCVCACPRALNADLSAQR